MTRPFALGREYTTSMSVTPRRCLSVAVGLACGKASWGTGAFRGTENCVFSHMIFRVPPPDPSLSMASVSWSTGWSRASFFMSTRATSWVSSTGTPHFPTLELIASFEAPVAEGTE